MLLLERILDRVFGACDVVMQTGPVPPAARTAVARLRLTPEEALAASQ